MIGQLLRLPCLAFGSVNYRISPNGPLSELFYFTNIHSYAKEHAMKARQTIKSALIALAAVAAMAVQPAQASTYTINSFATNVGQVDTMFEHATLANSSDAGEIAWVQSVLGFNYTMTTKIEMPNEGPSPWVKADGPNNVYATDLGLGAGDYFFIKIGANDKPGGQKVLDTHFLFQNVDSLSWAVIDLVESFGGDVALKNIGKVSHIGNVSAVPLPAAAWLFGSALFGFMMVSNRKKV